MSRKKINRHLSLLVELARSEKLSQGQRTLLKKSIKNLYRGIATNNKKVVVKEIGRISKILLEIIN